jgi:hypothetical protein
VSERRALDFFRSYTAPNLASYFDADFWTRVVMQIGQTEPAIRHAMIAVGELNRLRQCCVHEAGLPTRRTIVMQDPLSIAPAPVVQPDDHNEPFALIHYNKAISHLAKRMRDEPGSADIALLACILFVCLEFLRRDDAPAMRHFKSGMNIALTTAKNDCSGPYNQMHTIRAQMLPFFHRLELLSMLFGNDPSYDYPVELPDAVPAVFASLNDARDSLVHLLNLNLRFIRSVRFHRYDGSLSDAHRARQQELLDSSAKWKCGFDLLLATRTLPDKDVQAANVLHIHYIVSKMWLRRCTSSNEMETDDDIPDYEVAVRLAELLQSEAGTREKRSAYPSTFLFDMEVVSPIYLVAVKCRSPSIRRRAIAVLKSSCRQEGLWDSNVVAAIAERVMELEEANMNVLDGSERPAERMRIHNTLIQSGKGLSPNFYQLTLYRRAGPNGEWDVWQESFVLRP